ncbi:MAG: helix-turn-helix domain-containing protein [Gemmataceae bacterium]
MRTPRKLPGSERRASIIRAVRHLFANKGFKGTRTREIAAAAGVSEALLYRHFPTKEALFAAIQQSFCDDPTRARFERIDALPPSTRTLVLYVHHLVVLVLTGTGDGEDRAIHNRMILRSLAEDGSFARLLLQPITTSFLPRIEACLRAAAATGDAGGDPEGPLGGWLVYNLAAMTSFLSTPTTPVVDFDDCPSRLTRQIVCFALRGLGLHEDAIRRHYPPEPLSALEI